MTGADGGLTPRLRNLPPLDLYVILDPGVSGGRELAGLADAVLAAGVRWIQLRAKETATRDLLALARRLVERVRAHAGVLIVNDRLDIALAAGAHGVHLGQEDLPVPEARRLAPVLVLGASTHSLAEARRAESEGADYVALGSIFPTASKAGFALVGLETLSRVRPHVGVPLVGIGGITVERVPAVRAAGADGVAVISSVGLAPDPAAVAAAFLEALRGCPVPFRPGFGARQQSDGTEGTGAGSAQGAP